MTRSRESTLQALGDGQVETLPYSAMNVPFSDTPSDAMRRVVSDLGRSETESQRILEGDFAGVRLEPSPDCDALAPYTARAPEGTEFTCWGIGRLPVATDDGYVAGSRMHYPLAGLDTERSLEDYPFPNLLAGFDEAALSRRVEELKNQQYVVIGQMSQTILETAYNMRGIEQFMVDLYERPSYTQRLCHEICIRRVEQARALVRCGVDILRLGDDIATQDSLIIGPALYQERIKPFHAKVAAAAKDTNPNLHILYHSDGNLTGLLPDLVDIGVGLINPVQPECMDLELVKRRFGDNLVLWGCLPVQSLISTGSGEELRAFLRYLREDIASGGRVVLKLTNFLPTPRSLANLVHLFDEYLG